MTIKARIGAVLAAAVIVSSVLAGCSGGGGSGSAALPVVSTVKGDTAFWAVDFVHGLSYRISAKKMATGTYCYIYLEDGKSLDQATIDIIMNEFDNNIYPSTTKAFGNEPSPGIDNDPRITILLLDIKDGFNGTTQRSYIAGYFDSYDEYPYSDSNQREMFYMDIYPGSRVKPFFSVPSHMNFNT